MANSHPIEQALLTGSRAKNYALKIAELCARLPTDITSLNDKQRSEIVRLAAVCRSSKAVTAALSIDTLPSIDEVPEFMDLFCESYYPVLEDGKRTVGFWSIKDSATLTPEDVHEWVRDVKTDKKTGAPTIVPVPFSTWWKNHKPDYEIYGVAANRAEWNKKVIKGEDRICVNTMYEKPPVCTVKPSVYGDGKDAMFVLDEVLKRAIHDPDNDLAQLKRIGFIVDAGSHLLALRDFKPFRCRKLFCFTSTNCGQGTGKSLLHESIASLVPRDAACTVPTTELAGNNLLALYGASVCVLTEAPSTASERYTSEDIKSFADAGWKTATEKYVAKRPVCDNALKLLSSNHLAPLPVDSNRSRRLEFFTAIESNDGGRELHNLLSDVQAKTGWTNEQLRKCIGWALLERAKELCEMGYTPCDVARRSIDARHLLCVPDYDYFVVEFGNNGEGTYSNYKEFRSDHGFTWNPDKYRYEAALEMSKSVDAWLEGCKPCLPSSPKPTAPNDSESKDKQSNTKETGNDNADKSTEDGKQTTEVANEQAEHFSGFQFKTRTAKALLEPNKMGLTELYQRIVKDPLLKSQTQKVRDGTADKIHALPQIFPGTYFKKFSRRDSIAGFTGFTHIDFDYVAENGDGLTPEQIRDGLSELPGFVIGGLSSRGNGAWAIFYAGDKIDTIDKYEAAERALYYMAEDHICMNADKGAHLPTCGRVIAHDPDCRIAPEVVFGNLPEPYSWIVPKYKVSTKSLKNIVRDIDMTPVERARQEKFLEAVVANSCEKVQLATTGERHQTAIKAIANIVLCCSERGITPLESWGRQVRDACCSCGLPKNEVNDIMKFWKRRTGVSI